MLRKRTRDKLTGFNYWFEGIEETEQITPDEEICKKENVEILESPTIIKIKPDTAFNCFNTAKNFF